MQEENKMPGGYLVGDSHANGGIKIQTPEGQIEAEGGEVIVNKRALSLDDEFVCKGTPRDITSKINEMEGGVSWSEQGSCELVKKGPGERRVGDDYSNWGLENYDKTEYANGGGVDDKKMYEITFEDVFSFATMVKAAQLTDSQYQKAIQQMKNKDIVVDKFNEKQGIREQLRIKEITPKFKVGRETGIAARGKVIVTKISDIPNLRKELNAGRITYRGLGMGKLYDDFYEIANEPGTRIKVEGKEYYITDTDFRKLNWDEKNKKWKNLIRFSAPPRKAALGLNIFRRGDTGEKSKDDADKSEVRDNLRKLDIEYNNLKEEFSKNRAGTDYTIKDYINDKKELIERYRPYIDRAMALGIAVNAGLLYVPSNIQMANGTYMEERKYKIYSKNYPSYPSWTATEQEIIDFIEEETGRKPSDWSDGLNEIGLNYSEVVLTEDMAARGSILRTQDKSKRPSPAVSATIYPAGYRMEGNDGNMWEISVSSNGVHRWVKARAEDGMMTDSKSESSKSVVLEAIDNDDESKTQLWVYYPTYDIPGDVANRFQAEFKVIYVEQRVDSGYYSGYDTVTYIDENAYEYIADSVEDIRITDNDGDDVVLDAETERNIKTEIHKLFEQNIKGEEWESKTNIVLQDVKAANGLIVSSSCGCQHANGGKMENGGGIGKSEIEKLFIEATDKYNQTLKNLPDNAENWQIKNDKDRYYSVSMQTGKPVWNESPDLGYTFRKEVAETLKNKLNELGYDNLVLVQYDPNWWKANGGGIYANGGKLVGKRVRLIEMQDPYAVPKGTMGTIKFVDGIGQIHVNWDNGSSLALIPNVDKYKIIYETDLPEDYYQHAIEQDGKLYTGDSYSDISSSERVNFFNVEERTRGYVDKNNNFHALDLDYGTWAYAKGGGVGKKLPPIILKKLQEKLTISEKAINKWGGEYYDKVPQLIKDQIDGKTPFTYENYLMVQGDEEKDRYDIFIENNAIELAKKIKKIVDKYKNKEVSDTTVPSAPNSSSFMASVSGKIKLVVNFIQRGGYYSRDKNVLIGVLIGNGIDSVTQKKIKQDIYEVMFPYDQYNSSDGGVMWFTKSGTNYDTVGLMCNTFSFSDSLAEKIINIFNSNTFANGGGVGIGNIDGFKGSIEYKGNNLEYQANYDWDLGMNGEWEIAEINFNGEDIREYDLGFSNEDIKNIEEAILKEIKKENPRYKYLMNGGGVGETGNSEKFMEVTEFRDYPYGVKYFDGKTNFGKGFFNKKDFEEFIVELYSKGYRISNHPKFSNLTIEEKNIAQTKERREINKKDKDFYNLQRKFANGGGVYSFYVVKSWDLVEDKRKGVKPEIEKYQTRSEAIKAANKRQEMGYSLVEVEDENDNLIYKVSPERAENGKEFWFSPDNRMMKTAKKGTAKQMIEVELAKVFGATSMDQVGEDEINYIYELKGNPMMIAATTAMLEEERGLDVETWGKQKRVRIPKRVIDMMTTSLRYPLITPFADGGDLVSGYEAKSKPMVIEDSDSKKKTIREIELKLKDVDIPQAKIGSSQDAYAYFWQIWDKNAINIQEEFAILFLDRQNKVKSYHKLSKGGIASTVVDGALVVGIATKALASGVIVAHNHPSGNTQPSQSDIALTKELKNALKLVNINLLDSLIITPTEMSYYSLADEGIVFAEDGYYAGGGRVGKPIIKFNIENEEERTTISINGIGEVILVETYPEYEFLEDINNDEEILNELGVSEGDLIGKIEHIQIKDEYKGKGYAKLLMKKAIELAKEKGLMPLYLNASPMGYSGLNLADLTSFYKSFGFEVFLRQGGNNLMILKNHKTGYYASGGSVGYEVTLSASPNPDFDMDSHEATISIPEKRVKVSSLGEARSVVMKFIRDNDLGGGNWTGGEVYKDGQRVATISYNGRVWEGNTSSGIYSEITDLKKKANNGGYVISYGNRKLSRFDRGNIPYSSKWVNGEKIKKAVPEKFFRFSNSSWIVFDSVEDAKSSIDNWITEIENDDRYGEEIKKPLLKYAENLKNKIVQKYFDGGELAAYGKEIIRSLVGKTIKIVKLQSQIPDLLPVGTEGTIQSIENSGNINVNWDNSLTLPLIPGIDKYEIVFSDEDLSKYMGNKGDSFLIDRANVGEKSIYYLIRSTSPHHMIDLFFTTREEAQKFANKKGLIIKNEDFDIAEDGAMIDKIDTDIINIVSSYEIIEEEGYKMIDTDNNNIISNIKSVNKWNNLMFFGDDQGNMYEPAELQGKFVRIGSEVFMVPILDKEISMRNFDINELDSFERMIYDGYIEKGMSKTEALKTLINDYEDFADVDKSSPKLKEIATGFVPTIEKTEVSKYNGGPYRFKYDLYEVEYEIDENYPIILSVTLDGKEIDIDIFSDEELSDLNERAYQDFIQYNKENLAANGTTITKTYIFTHKNNPRMEIVVKLLPNMKIVDIDNDKGIRFPYSVGQILNMGHKTWACNNNYLVNGVDVCPEKKVFGIKVSDIPQGHPLRHIYPGKFK
jgi:DNA repair protein RadC